MVGACIMPSRTAACMSVGIDMLVLERRSTARTRFYALNYYSRSAVFSSAASTRGGGASGAAPGGGAAPASGVPGGAGASVMT